MSDIYTYNPSLKQLIPSSSAYPIIRLKSFPSSFDVNIFTESLNNTLNRSPTARAQLSRVSHEGIDLIGISPQAAQKQFGVSPRASGFSVHNGGQNPYNDNANIPFEIDAYVVLGDKIFSNGSFNYETIISSVLFHEGVSHPLEGGHKWLNYRQLYT